MAIPSVRRVVFRAGVIPNLTPTIGEMIFHRKSRPVRQRRMLEIHRRDRTAFGAESSPRKNAAEKAARVVSGDSDGLLKVRYRSSSVIARTKTRAKSYWTMVTGYSWAWLGSNQRPCAYQAHALTN